MLCICPAPLLLSSSLRRSVHLPVLYSAFVEDPDVCRGGAPDKYRDNRGYAKCQLTVYFLPQFITNFLQFIHSAHFICLQFHFFVRISSSQFTCFDSSKGHMVSYNSRIGTFSAVGIPVWYVINSQSCYRGATGRFTLRNYSYYRRQSVSCIWQPSLVSPALAYPQCFSYRYCGYHAGAGSKLSLSSSSFRRKFGPS